MPATSHPHNSWEPQRATSLEAAQRRARLVAVLRRAFLAGAGAAFASVFVFVALNTAGEGDPPRIAAPTQMLNPRFIGHSETEGAFEVTARAAERNAENPQNVDLIAPFYRAASGAEMSAPRGRFVAADNSVVFEGDVLIARAGANLRARSAVVDLERGTVSARGRVSGAFAPRQPR